jgi:tetratricopeptide (TPR) repeat protein
MGKGTKQLNSAILTFVIACCAGAPGLAKVTESGDKATLSQLEQRLFFKTYADESIDARLVRLEKQVFGDQAEGDFKERLERVKTAIGPQPAPDGTTPGQGSASSNPQPTAPPVDDKAAAIERAKISVMQAKEDEVQKLLADGVELWRQKKGPEAIDRFEQVVRLDPHNAEAHFNLGIVYESANNLVEAAASYKRASEEFPANKEYQDAIAAVDKKLKGRAKSDDLHGELRVLAEDAAAAYKRKEYFSAIDLYKQLDQKVPNQALVKYNIGTIYFVMNNYSDALEYYKMALKLKPNEPKYQQAVQQLSVNLKKSEEARAKVDAQWAAAESQPPQQQMQPPQQQMQPPQQQMQPPQQQMQPPQQQMQPPQQQMQPPQQQMQPPQQQMQPPQQQMQPPQQQMQPPQQQMQPPQQQMQPPRQSQQQVPILSPQQLKQQFQKQLSQPPQQQMRQPPNNVPPPPNIKPQDLMSSIGIIGKSTHDGVRITTIGIASRAAKIGLQQGDIIKAVDGTVVKSTSDVNLILSGKQLGAPVQLTIQRNKQMAQVVL